MMGDGSLGKPGNIQVGVTAHDIFLAWERLRLLYNVAFGCFLLLNGHGFRQLSEPWFPKFFVVFAFVANVAFCLGPCAEGYLAWCCGVHHRLSGRLPIRLALFVMGMLLTFFMAYVGLIEKILHPDAPNFALRGPS